MVNQHYRYEPFLPTELISLILGHIHPLDRIPTLYTCSLVSTQFYSIANPLLWNATDFPCITVKRLLNCLNGQSSLPLSPGRHLQRLTLVDDSCSTKDDHYFLRLLPHLPHLTYIQLSIQVTDIGIQQLARHCPHMIHIELQGVTIESKGTFQVLAHNCSQLEVLYLRDCNIVPPHALQSLLQDCSHFQKLTLESCKLDESTIVKDIIQSAHGLSYLRLAGLSRESIKSLFLLASTPLFNKNKLDYPLAKLTTLFVLNGHGLDDSIWLGFIKKHPKIHDITLRDCAMTDRGLVTMATECYLPELKHLRLMRCPYISSNGVREMILHTGSTLLTLQCHHCSRIRSNHFPEICSSHTTNIDFFDDCQDDDDMELNATDMGDIRNAYNKEIKCV